MEISFQARTSEELSKLDPVALAAQVDTLQMLLVLFMTSFDEDAMPDAIRGTLDRMDIASTLVMDQGSLSVEDAETLKDRYMVGISKTIKSVREMVS